MTKHPFIYEINTVVWLHELSRSYGGEMTLGRVPTEEWDRLRDLGFNFVWLMGVWKRSEEGMEIFRKEPEFVPFKLYLNSVFPGWAEDDLIGSPYSIADYSPDRTIGTWDDIDSAREELNRRGMGLILDFVPNHTAPDHQWVQTHPDFYIQGSREEFDNNPYIYTPVRVDGKELYITRGKDPFYAPWTDTVQLNYFNTEMREALIREFAAIGEHCDGLRCDMAMLVLNETFTKHWSWANNDSRYAMPDQEFWEQARNTLPEHMLIAEAYWETEWLLQELGFDYVYDKRLYDRIRHLAPHDLTLHLRADSVFQNKLVRFIENHDEARSASVFNKKQLGAASLIFSTVPGMRLFYNGQLEGRKIRTPVQLRRAVPEDPDREIRNCYKKLLGIVKHDVFRNGTWELKETYSLGDSSYLNIVAWIWRSEKSKKLVVVNLGRSVARAGILLPDDVQRDIEYIFYDELNDQEYFRKGSKILEKGLLVILDEYRAHVFDIKIR